MKKYIGHIISIVFILIFVLYFVRNPSSFDPIREVSFLSLVSIFLLKFLVVFINGLFIKYVLNFFDKVISIGETTYISLISSVGNYFIPLRGGAGIRAVYLKTKYSFPYSDYVTTLSGNYIISFMINSGLGLLALIFVSINQEVYPLILYLFFGGILFSTLFIIIFSIPTKVFETEYKIKLINTFTDILARIIKGWNAITKDKSLLIKLFILTFLNFVIFVVTAFIEFNAIGVSMQLHHLFLYAALGSLSLLVSLTPGSLGIRESIFLVFSSILLISNDNILQVAVIDRGIGYLMLFVGYLITRIPQVKKFLNVSDHL